MSDFMRTLCRIAVPVTLQGMLQASFSVVDQLMIGQLGEAGIAAVGLCGNFTLIFSVVLGAVCTVAGILIAQFLGAGEEAEAWRSLDVSLVCGGTLAVLFLLAAGGFPAQLLGLYTADEGICRTGAVYFSIVAFSYLPMAVSGVLSAWLRCKEHATIPFLASLGAVAANTGLNYLLIFGKLGAPALGITGAAVATLVSQLLNLLLILAGFGVCLQKEGQHPLWFLRFETLTLGTYGAMILPILVSEFLWSLGQNVESAVYGHLGTESLAAYTLTCPLQSLVMGALGGLSAAAGVMVGKELGKKDEAAAYAASQKLMAAGLVGAAAVSALLILLAGPYTHWYRVAPQVKRLGQQLLVVFALYAPIKVENMILGGGILRSGGNTKIIMVIDCLGTWCVGIPLCLLAAYGFRWGILGVYALLTAEEVFRLALSLVMFRKRSWMVSLS